MAMMGTDTITPPTGVTTPATADDDDGPGWTSRWIRHNPVSAVALVLVLVSVVWRAEIGSRGFLAQDDFYLAIRAAEVDALSWDHLLGLFNNHMMPGGLLITWYVTKTLGLVYWPYLTLMLAGHAVLGVAFYRLLRLLLPQGWSLLVPLCLLLFSPLTLETTSWWVFGMAMLPMMLAMVWAMGAQVKFVRTGRWRHLMSLTLAMLFGLLFSEKTLLVVPLVFGLTACLLVKGSPGRSIWRAASRHWPSWLVLMAITAGYLTFYSTRATASLRTPESAPQVVTFFRQFFADNLIPGLFGGPWRWSSDIMGPSLAEPGMVLRLLAVAALLALVVFTVWKRPAAGRAWLLLVGYALLAGALIAATRLGAVLSPLAGLTPRYTADVAVVGALCIGVALAGLPSGKRAVPRRLAIGAVAIVLSVGTVISTIGFADHWAVQPGRDFLATARAELAKAPAGTVFLDEIVPEAAMARYYYPYNLQSRFFGVLPQDQRPVFVTEAENPSVFDPQGHIRPAWVDGRKIVAGPDGDCGYSIEGGTTATMPLDGPTIRWPWVVRIAYVSSAETAVTFRLGQGTHRFVAQQGLHQIFFTVEGEGDKVELTVARPGVQLCTNEITVGLLTPWYL